MSRFIALLWLVVRLPMHLTNLLTVIPHPLERGQHCTHVPDLFVGLDLRQLASDDLLGVHCLSHLDLAAHRCDLLVDRPAGLGGFWAE